MRDHKECTKGFSQLSKAWYGEVNLKNAKYSDQITIGFYHPDGGTTGEFEIRWEELGGKLTPKLTAYDDSWDALSKMPELISKLADLDERDVSPDDFSMVLREIGFEDFTAYEDKDAIKENPMVKEIHEAYQFLRKNNNTISSGTIEFMKNVSLEYLSEKKELSHGGYQPEGEDKGGKPPKRP